MAPPEMRLTQLWCSVTQSNIHSQKKNTKYCRNTKCLPHRFAPNALLKWLDGFASNMQQCLDGDAKSHPQASENGEMFKRHGRKPHLDLVVAQTADNVQLKTRTSPRHDPQPSRKRLKTCFRISTQLKLGEEMPTTSHLSLLSEKTRYNSKYQVLLQKLTHPDDKLACPSTSSA